MVVVVGTNPGWRIIQIVLMEILHQLELWSSKRDVWFFFIERAFFSRLASWDFYQTDRSNTRAVAEITIFYLIDSLSNFQNSILDFSVGENKYTHELM